MSSDLNPVPDDFSYDVTVRSLQTSEKVFGRYDLRRVLGRGGMGVVWLAHDERLERDVALKFLPDEVYHDASALDELKRETRRCLDLTHPNIIRIYDFLKDEKAAAISMEYIDGKTLAELRVEKENRVFEADEIKNWILMTCQALYYAHEEVGVVHRDLKPANLMLTSRGQIKIADFGIAQTMGDTLSRMTLRRGTSGTLAYMSPQQLSGDLSRPTDDIYAIGAAIYELLTSKPPFSSGDISFQVRVSVPRTMAERRHELGITGAEIPAAWEQAVSLCLSKMPSERPQDMLALAELLGLGPATTRPAIPAQAVSPAPESRKSAPAATPAPVLPQRPIPIQTLIAVGTAVLFLLSLWPIWIFGISPFLGPPGKLRLTTLPPGVTVHLSGQPDHVTPVEFPHLRRGVYRMTLSAPGFETQERKVTIVSGQESDPGTIVLLRMRGNLNLATVPIHAHYQLAGGSETGNYRTDGTTPDFLSNLPAGRYQLTLSTPGIADQSRAIEIPDHATQIETPDLGEEALAAGADPLPAQAFRGQLDAAKLDEPGRNELAQLDNQSFEDYLHAGLLAAASDQLAKLKTLGRDTSQQQSELIAKRASTENEIAGELSGLIADRRYGAAEKKLRVLDGVLEKESVDRLKAEFDAPLLAHRQPVIAAIRASENEPPAEGYAEIKDLARHDPDNLDLEIALADVQMRMAPDHERLSTQLRDFNEFSAQNKDLANDPGLLDREAAFSMELQQLDALAAARDASTNLQNEIARLETRETAMEDIRVGKPKGNPFTQTVNFFGKAVTGHSVIDNAAYFETAQDKADAILAIQTQITQDQANLAASQTSSADALKRYNDFVAQVPWGQNVEPAGGADGNADAHP